MEQKESFPKKVFKYTVFGLALLALAGLAADALLTGSASVKSTLTNVS